MKDVQKELPKHQIPIHRVGIKNLKVPIYISKMTGGEQHSVADVDVYVDLDKNSKGTHMSRLAIGVQKFIGHQLNKNVIVEIADYIKNKCDAKTCQIIYRFPYFIRQIAPVSKEPNIIHSDVEFNLTKNDSVNFDITVTTTATSLCPCSKDISEYGAHNQRSKIKLTARLDEKQFVWIEDLIHISNTSASCKIHSVLKRIDEKAVTEEAYDNPVFVEDIVRSCYQQLSKLDIKDFNVEVENQESIHTHEAYASIKKN